MIEEWRTIEGYQNYQVSNLGNVRCLDYMHTKKTHLLKPTPNKNGYLLVPLYNCGIKKRFQIHRLVAMAFIPNPDNLPCVNHRDERKDNNCASNLEWCNQLYNLNYGTRNKRLKKSLTNHPSKSKPVIAYKDGVEVMRFPSTREAERNGYDNSNVGRCCKGKQKQYKGLTWKYAS